MRARWHWASVSENIGPKMCWKLVNENRGEIIDPPFDQQLNLVLPTYKSIQLSPNQLKKRLKKLDQDDVILGEFMLLADFDTPYLRMTEKDQSTESKTWQDIEQGEEHPEHIQ